MKTFSTLKGACVAALSLSVSLISACSSEQPETHGLFKTIPADQLDIKANTLLIDARSPDAFNGWILNEKDIELHQTAGHIPGAQLLSASWIERDLKGLERAYKRIEPEGKTRVVVYGSSEKQASVVANWLVSEQNWSSDNIQILNDGFSAWTNEPGHSADYLPGYRSLVPPQYVAQIQASKPNTKIIQIGWDGGKGSDYREEHIPGAIYWDDMEFEKPPIYELTPVQEIRNSLAKLGLNKDSSVIVYSTESIGAARGAAVLKYAGIRDVVMLNGGIENWKAAGFPVEAGWNTPIAIKDFGQTGPGDESVVIDIEQAAHMRQQPKSALVSIRSWDEFAGKVSGYNYFEKRGRIPGALWGHAGDSSWDMNHFHNPDNTMRSYHQIARFWQQWGIQPDMNLSFYCGNGWRASEAWWYAQAMGYTNTTVYSSGWMRWREDNMPVASGDITREQSIAAWKMTSSEKVVTLEN